MRGGSAGLLSFAGGPPDKFVFYYHYHPSRAHNVVEDFFTDYSGYLHCDGYPGYDALVSKNREIKLVGCLYHARRKFVEVAKLAPNKEGVAAYVIKLIAELAQIEESIKALSTINKYQIRLEKSKPILDKILRYLQENQPTIPPKSLLGQAVSYTLNQWPKIITYLRNGRLEISNNRSERAIKPFVIGRKGWLFSYSVEGANSAAIIYSVIETCKYHQIEPYEYLRYVLQMLPQCKTVEDYEALLPYNIDKQLLVSNIH